MQVQPRRSLYFLLAMVSFLLITSCASTRNVVGKWREIGKTATLEFRKDGTFRAVDNQGMAVSGTYALHGNEKATFTVVYQDSAPEIIECRISVRGDELTIAPERGDEPERYRREK